MKLNIVATQRQRKLILTPLDNPIIRSESSVINPTSVHRDLPQSKLQRSQEDLPTRTGQLGRKSERRRLREKENLGAVADSTAASDRCLPALSQFLRERASLRKWLCIGGERESWWMEEEGVKMCFRFYRGCCPLTRVFGYTVIKGRSVIAYIRRSACRYTGLSCAGSSGPSTCPFFWSTEFHANRLDVCTGTG